MLRLWKAVSICLLLAGTCASEDAIEMVNSQRARRKLGPLVVDPILQKAAEHKASVAAKRRYRGHLGGSLYSANYEGIGYGMVRKFRACYLYTAKPGTRCGAAIIKGSDGCYYCCFLIRSKVRLSPR